MSAGNEANSATGKEVMALAERFNNASCLHCPISLGTVESLLWMSERRSSEVSLPMLLGMTVMAFESASNERSVEQAIDVGSDVSAFPFTLSETSPSLLNSVLGKLVSLLPERSRSRSDPIELITSGTVVKALYCSIKPRSDLHCCRLDGKLVSLLPLACIS